MLEKAATDAATWTIQSYGLAGLLVVVFVAILLGTLWFMRSLLLRQTERHEADMEWARAEIKSERKESGKELASQRAEFVQALKEQAHAQEQALARLESFWTRRLDSIEARLPARP